MSYTEHEERIAVLLSALGNDVARNVLSALPGDAGARVQKLLDAFTDDPLEEEELEEVLDEFMRFFRFAMQQVSADAESEQQQQERTEAKKAESERLPEKKPFVATGDPLQDLRQLESYQIAGALRGEGPRTIAVVLNCLPSELAGGCLQFLPEDVRATTFLMLRDPPRTPPQMLDRILRTTVSKGCELDLSAVADPTDEANRKMADLLRAMGQSERAQMLKTLEAKDADVVEQIKKLLYTFDDVRKLAGRSAWR
jgi:flagellar motor switch protein FliG